MEEKISKALAGLVDAARPVEERYAELLELDENHFVRHSKLPPACVMDIWASDKVSESWKRKTLVRMMKANSFYGVMFVPLELEFDCPLNRSILELIRNQGFDELEGVAFAEKLAEAERTVEGFWGALLRHRDGAGRHVGPGTARLFARGEDHLRHLPRHDVTLDGRDDELVWR